jgi:hypothetical protein
MLDLMLYDIHSLSPIDLIALSRYCQSRLRSISLQILTLAILNCEVRFELLLDFVEELIIVLQVLMLILQ